jgi:hypothetical protein
MEIKKRTAKRTCNKLPSHCSEDTFMLNQTLALRIKIQPQVRSTKR